MKGMYSALALLLIMSSCLQSTAAAQGQPEGTESSELSSGNFGFTELHIVVYDSHIDLPQDVPVGQVLVRLVNELSLDVELELVRLPPGMSVDRARATLNADNGDSAWRDGAYYPGLPVLQAPGEVAQAVITIRSGTYILHSPGRPNLFASFDAVVGMPEGTPAPAPGPMPGTGPEDEDQPAPDPIPSPTPEVEQQPECDYGFVFDENRGYCVEIPDCPEGEIWDDQQLTCVSDPSYSPPQEEEPIGIQVEKYDCNTPDAYDHGYDELLQECQPSENQYTFVHGGDGISESPQQGTGFYEWSGDPAGNHYVYEQIPDGYGQPRVFCGIYVPQQSEPSPTEENIQNGNAVGWQLNSGEWVYCYWFNIEHMQQEPLPPDVEALISNETVTLSGRIRLGWQFWSVTNESTDPRPLLVYRVPDGTTVDDVVAVFANDEGTPISLDELGFVRVGGTFTFSPGFTVTIGLKVDPGTHVAVSQLSDHAGEAVSIVLFTVTA